MLKYFSENLTANTAKIIITTLRALGLGQSYKGFNYLIHAINRTLENPDSLSYICKDLYLDIAFSYNTSVSCVERNIRTAKQIIWRSDNTDLLKCIFGDQYASGIPNNAIFIGCLVHYIQQLTE